MSPERELVGHDGRKVVFRGIQLARAAPPPERLDRWTDVVIWRTDGDRYIGQVDACSRRPGEITLRRVHVCENADDLVDALEHEGRLSWPVRSALLAAAERDEAVAGALADYEEDRTTHVP